MKTYSIIKRNYGVELNQRIVKNYATKEDAINAGNSWLRDCTIHAEIRKGWNFEVIEKMKTISIPRQQFLNDLETCLTVTKRISRNLFECEYITPALYKRIVIVTTF